MDVDILSDEIVIEVVTDVIDVELFETAGTDVSIDEEKIELEIAAPEETGLEVTEDLMELELIAEPEIVIEVGEGSRKAEWGFITGELSDQEDLKAALDGKSDVGHTHDDRYYTEAETDTLLSGKSDTGHDHDGRYYTEAETDSLLSLKSDTGHDHDGRYYTEAETDGLLAGKQATLTFDAAPTAGSANPVTSGGIKTALDGKMPANPIRIEFTTSPTDPFGGYIDFHYAGSSADYTARIIETANYVSLVGKKLSLVSGPLETQFGGTGGSDTGWQAAGVTEGIPLAYTGTIYYRKIGIFVTVIAQDIKLKTALPSAGSFVTLCRMPAGICSIVNTSEWTLASVTDPGIVTLKSSRDVSFNCGKNQGWPVTWGISFTLSFIAN